MLCCLQPNAILGSLDVLSAALKLPSPSDALALLVRCPQLLYDISIPSVQARLEQLSVVLACSSEEAREAALRQPVSTGVCVWQMLWAGCLCVVWGGGVRGSWFIQQYAIEWPGVDAVALLVRCPQLLEQLSVVLAWSSEEARDAALQQLVSFLVQLTPFVAVRGHRGGVVGDEGSDCGTDSPCLSI